MPKKLSKRTQLLVCRFEVASRAHCSAVARGSKVEEARVEFEEAYKKLEARLLHLETLIKVMNADMERLEGF